MEFLVTMTTHVPEGTSPQAVDDVRRREAERSRQLAAQGNLVRLWRPPLQPGEWRSIGLFAADDADQLQTLLASMPLHVWRSDTVTPLTPHPNDPPHSRWRRAGDSGSTEFLVDFTTTVPPGTARPVVDEMNAREAERSRELVAQGHLLRLWRPPVAPGELRAVGLYRARDATEMQAILEALPMHSWMTVQTTPLAPHPSDPGLAPVAGR